MTLSAASDPDIVATEIVEDLPWRAAAWAKEASGPRHFAEIASDLKKL